MKTLLPKVLVCVLCFGFTIALMAQKPPIPIRPMPVTIVAPDPATPISSLPYTISAQGSYFLTGNLTASGSTAGIIISADNVTLDLKGFAVVGGGSGSVAGINVPSAQKNILIRNGTVRDWTNGGVNAANATNSVVQGLRLSNNTATNTFSNIAALSVGSGSTVKDCVVAHNTNCHGISVGNACLVSGCIARANSNGVGIRAADSCYVIGNISDSNTTGIAMGSGNRIDSNSCTSNVSAGVLAPSGATNNLVMRNNARSNNPNYNIAIGNRYGTIADQTSGATGAAFGNSAITTLVTTDPWANFAY